MVYLRVAFFRLSDAESPNLLEAYAREANELLKPHDMKLRHRYGEGPATPDDVMWNGYVTAGDKSAGLARLACHQLWPDGKGIPVILCNRGRGPGYPSGFTIPTGAEPASGGAKWLPFCFINGQKINPANSTIVHELIHATGLGNDDHDDDPTSVFFQGRGHPSEEELARKRVLSAEHAARLRTAYFAEYA